jgi:hypothetical protein
LLATRRFEEKMTMGGLLLNALKKLYGARFGTPSVLMVLAKAIGRGATAESIYWCKSLVAIWVGSILSIWKQPFGQF